MLIVDRYPKNIDCKKMVDVGAVSCGQHFKCSEAWEERLEVVKIYFNTPTFDRITRDAKTNSMAKVSMIGGTFGLLTGTRSSSRFAALLLGPCGAGTLASRAGGPKPSATWERPAGAEFPNL